MKCRGVEDGCIDRRTALAGLVATAGWAWAGPAAAETGVTDTRIKVGQSAVFTGPAKDFGVDYKAGIALYFDKVNKTGKYMFTPNGEVEIKALSRRVNSYFVDKDLKNDLDSIS